MLKVILCHATGKAYTNETEAYLNGCDIEAADEAEIPDDQQYVWHGTPADGGGKLVFLDGQEAMDWMVGAGIGAAVTALRVQRPQ